MKKTRTTRTLLAAVSVVAFTAALYGCSGSDGSGGSQTGTPGGPTQDEQVAALQAEINALRAQLGLAPDASLGDSVASLQAEVKRLRDEAQARMDAEQAAKDKEMAAEARKLAAVLDDPIRFPVFGDTLRVTATYGKPATVEAIFGGANSNFMDKNSRSLPARQGWSGTELMSTSADGSTTYTMRIYTDVEPDETVPFAEWAAATTDVAWANGAVTVAAGNSALVMAPVFAAHSGSRTHEKNTETDAASAGPDTFQTPGTFAGAAGTYTCTGATCTSAVASSTGGVILTGTWTFTPNNGATAKVADDDYGHFGWWLRKADGGYQIVQFASQGDYPTQGGISSQAAATAVAGTATYTGPAEGLYSIYDSGPKGGHFTAEVELMADFGTAAQAGTVSGMISNFRDGAGANPGGMDTWEVALPATPIGVGAGFGAARPTPAQRPVWTIDGEAGTPASSNALYYGYFYAPDDNGTPQAATGGFRAEYGVIGYMTGGYGVTHSGP